MELTKTCCRCKIAKEYSCFSPNTRTPTGLAPRCKTCDNAYQRERRMLCPEIKRASALKYYRSPKGQAKSIEYRKQNRERLSQRVAEYIKRPEAKAKQKIRQKRYHERKLHTDPGYRIKITLSARVRAALKRVNVKKHHTTIEMTGCSRDHLIIHLQSLFQPGMNWHNHGLHVGGGPDTWHIDHIIPCTAFDLTDTVEQLKCFHWSNLQPMWWKENVQKSDSITTPARYWDDTLGRWAERSVDEELPQPHQFDDHSSELTNGRRSCALPQRPDIE
jgi:hypothetical protein